MPTTLKDEAAIVGIGGGAGLEIATRSTITGRRSTNARPLASNARRRSVYTPSGSSPASRTPTSPPSPDAGYAPISNS